MHPGPQARTSPGPKALLQISLSTVCWICGPHCSPAKETGCNRGGERRTAAGRPGSPGTGPGKPGVVGREEQREDPERRQPPSYRRARAAYGAAGRHGGSCVFDGATPWTCFPAGGTPTLPFRRSVANLRDNPRSRLKPPLTCG